MHQILMPLVSSTSCKGVVAPYPLRPPSGRISTSPRSHAYHDTPCIRACLHTTPHSCGNLCLAIMLEALHPLKSPEQCSMHSPAPSKRTDHLQPWLNDTQEQGTAGSHAQPLNPGQTPWQEVPSDPVKNAANPCSMSRRTTGDTNKA